MTDDLSLHHDGQASDMMLRTAQQELVDISAMADQKANIVLGVSAIMTTAVVGVLPSTGLTVGLAILGSTTVVAAVLALLSLLPSTGRSDGDPNPLFFADVARMPYAEFAERMRAIVRDRPEIYDAIFTDLHGASKVLLEHKYRYLRLAYMVFVGGLILTVLGVVIDLAVGNI